MRIRFLRYAGGKGNMLKKILQYIEAIPHITYVEPFGGGGSILLNKTPSRVEVYNDIDCDIVNLFRVVRDNFDEFVRLVSLTPYSRQQWKECKQMLAYETDPVRRAWCLFVVLRQSIGGMLKDWGYNVKTHRRGMAETVCKWLNAIDSLPLVLERLKRVQIENDDFRKMFERYDSDDTLFYCDPPYLNTNYKFRYTMSKDDHMDLINLATNARGAVLISANESYDFLDWYYVEWKTSASCICRSKTSNLQGKGAALKNAPRTERLYFNEKAKKLTGGYVW